MDEKENVQPTISLIRDIKLNGTFVNVLGASEIRDFKQLGIEQVSFKTKVGNKRVVIPWSNVAALEYREGGSVNA